MPPADLLVRLAVLLLMLAAGVCIMDMMQSNQVKEELASLDENLKTHPLPTKVPSLLVPSPFAGHLTTDDASIGVISRVQLRQGNDTWPRATAGSTKPRATAASTKLRANAGSAKTQATTASPITKPPVAARSTKLQTTAVSAGRRTVTDKVPFDPAAIRQRFCPAALLTHVQAMQQLVASDGSFLRQPLVHMGSSGLGDELRTLVAAMLWSLALQRPLACKTDLSFIHSKSGFGVRPGLLDCSRNMRTFRQQQSNKSTAVRIQSVVACPNSTKQIFALMRDGKRRQALQLTTINYTWLHLGRCPLVGNWLFAQLGLPGNATKTKVTDTLLQCLHYIFFEPTPALDKFLHTTFDTVQASPVQPEMIWFNPHQHVVKADQRPENIVTVHARFGGQLEGWHDPVRATVTDVAGTLLPCTWNTTLALLAAISQSEGQPQPAVISWHLASDNLPLLLNLTRDFLAQQSAADMPTAVVQARWISFGYVAHFTRSSAIAQQDPQDGAARLWEDLYFMAMASSYVYVDSGFPALASAISTRRRTWWPQNGVSYIMEVNSGKSYYLVRGPAKSLTCPRFLNPSRQV